MPSSFPGSVDSFVNPLPTDSQSAVPHHDQHGDANDAIVATQQHLLNVVPTGGAVGQALIKTSATDYDTEWGTVASGGGGGGGGLALLGWVAYRPGADATTTTTSTTLVDVDATNVAVTFIAPESGEVIVEHGAYLQSPSGNLSLGIRDSVGVVGLSQMVLTGSSAVGRVTAKQKITGLTAGQSYTWKAAWATSAGTGTAYWGPTYGPWTMEIWDAEAGSGSGGGGGTSLVALHDYRPATNIQLGPSAAATFQDIDATNAAITFTVPDNGEVFIRWAITVAATNINTFFALFEGATQVPNTEQIVVYGTTSVINVRAWAAAKVTGLTPGSTHTYKMAFRKETSSGTVNAYSGPTYGPVTMEVWSTATSSSGGGGGGGSKHVTLFAGGSGGSLAFANVGATPVELSAASPISRMHADLAGYTQARAIGVGSSAVSVQAKMAIQYSLDDGATWAFIDETNDGPWAQMHTTNYKNFKGNWFTMDTAAKADVLLRAVAYGGNGTEDPGVFNVALELK